MNSYLFFYLVSMADRLHEGIRGAFIVSISAAVVGLIAFIAGSVEGEEVPIKVGKRIFRTLTIALPLLAIMHIAVPTRNDLLLIAAGGTIGEYAKADTNLRQIPNELTDWIRKEIQQAKEDKED